MDIEVQGECGHMMGPLKQNFSCEMIHGENRHLLMINGELSLTIIKHCVHLFHIVSMLRNPSDPFL